MTAEEEKTIRLLETRVRQLILKFQQVKEENKGLSNNIVQKDGELEEAKKRIKLLEADYANLKMAKMLEIGDNDITAAKQRITRLVRDVDKCIALLKGTTPDA